MQFQVDFYCLFINYLDAIKQCYDFKIDIVQVDPCEDAKGNDLKRL